MRSGVRDAQKTGDAQDGELCNAKAKIEMHLIAHIHVAIM
jgi:hypothetical protein